MNWNDIFEYRDGELFWTVKPIGKVQIGSKAGFKAQGYFRLKYQQKQYCLHRVVWEMFNGKIRKGLFIDHIDGNGFNNKIENLRLVTPIGNARNLAKQERNKSGFVGVRWDEQRKKWFVHITLKNKMYNLGRFDDKAEAIAVRKKAEKKNRFHPNHGRCALL